MLLLVNDLCFCFMKLSKIGYTILVELSDRTPNAKQLNSFIHSCDGHLLYAGS